MSCSENDKFCDALGKEYQIDILKNIEYSKDLWLDLYKPKKLGDYLKPIIILAHGMGDTKEAEDLTFHCRKLAHLGFVVASIGWSPPTPFSIDSTLYFQTGIQPIVDFQKAMAFFLTDARNENQFQIDTTNIFIGGSSFGAITSMHIGFVDSLQEFPNAFGKEIEGQGINNSLWQQHQQKVKGVINLAGWIWDTAFLDSNDPGLISIHGENDELIPFNSDTAAINNIKIMLVYGPGSIHKKLNELKITNDLFVVPNGGHVSYYESQWRDSTSHRVYNFLKTLTCDQ